VEFYREFGLAYDRARQLKVRPRLALTAANEWMSDSQCAAYLKRARALGLVQSAPRGQVAGRSVVQRPAAPVPAPEATPGRPRRGRASTRALDWTPEQSGDVWFSPDVELRCANAQRTGQPVTVDDVRRHAPGRLSEAQARAVLDWAVASEYATRDRDGVSVHPD
jgi:hypothetical protein